MCFTTQNLSFMSLLHAAMISHRPTPAAVAHTSLHSNLAVYGRENRLKVARDEAAAADEQRKVQEKHEAAEREHRHRLLLERARGRHNGPASFSLDDTTPAHALSPPEHLGNAPAAAEIAADTDAMRLLEGLNSPALQPPPAHSNAALLASTAPPSSSKQPPGALVHHPEPHTERLEHINLFAEEEAKARHPERRAEERTAAQRRGDPATQTSDPKFDERFGFAHGMTGREAVPWYARMAPPAGGGGGDPPQVAQLAEWHRRAHEALLGGANAADEGTVTVPGEGSGNALLDGVRIASGRGSGDDGGKGSNRRRHERGEKEKKSKRKRKAEERGGEGADVWSALREERLRREAAERRREAEAVRAATGGGDAAPGGRRYYNAYGYGRS